MIQINYEILNLKLRQFIAFINYKTKMQFKDFRSNPYIFWQEGYKEEIRRNAFNSLSYLLWDKNCIGTGKILDSIISSIELPMNNLVIWQDRYGPGTKEHQKIIELKSNKSDISLFEEQTYNFYFNKISDEYYFNYLISVVGKKYSLIAYILFIKDSELYLPISTTNFDNLFSDLNISLKTTKQCSWENYSNYLEVISNIRVFVSNKLNCDMTLLDTHSFCWILTSQMRTEDDSNFINDYIIIEHNKDKDAIIKARIGQSTYRTNLIHKWGGKCSVNDYSNNNLLIASHIKPWKDCNNFEAIDSNNGLLLTPNYDILFDKGYISFNNEGYILISSKLNELDRKEFGISNNIRITIISSELLKYLKYHQQFIFNK
jgi:hypothetical protein